MEEIEIRNMEEKKKRKPRKKKEFRYGSSFTMRFDVFTLEMMDRIAYDEDQTRTEVVRASVRHLFLKKYGPKELDILRKKYRKDILRQGKVDNA